MAEMPATLEIEFNEAMLNIYRRVKAETKYNATFLLQMVVDQGGLQAVRTLINSSSLSTGFAELRQPGPFDLSVEAMVLRPHRYHPLFTSDELKVCEQKLPKYGYQL